MATLPQAALDSIQNAINHYIEYNQELGAEFKTQYEGTLVAVDRVYAITQIMEATARPEFMEIKGMLDETFRATRQSGFIKEVRSLENNSNALINHFEQYKLIYKELSDRIIEKISSLEKIHGIIQGMKVIAKEIKLFSINSVIVSAQAGSKGVGFKSISHFIIELSDAIQKAAVQLEIYRDKILDSHAVLQKNFKLLIENMYEKKVSEVKEKVDKSIYSVKNKFGALTDLIEDLSKRLGGVLNEAANITKGNRAGTRRFSVLNYLQNAISIVAQSGTGFQTKMTSESDNTEFLRRTAYYHHIIKNISRRLDVSLPQLESFSFNVQKLFKDILAFYGSVHQDQMYVFNYMSTPTTSTGQSFLKDIFGETNYVIELLQQMLSEESTLRENLLNTFTEMEKIHQEGLTFFSNFEKFFVTMNNINVLAQIEMSKTVFDTTNNQNLKNKFSTMLHNIKEFNADIKNNIEKMLSNLIVEISKFSSINSEQTNALFSTTNFLYVQKYTIDNLYKNILSLINKVKDGNPKVFASEVTCKKFLADFSDVANVFIPFLKSMQKETQAQEDRFDGLIKFYQIGIKLYNSNNQFIGLFEKDQKQFN